MYVSSGNEGLFQISLGMGSYLNNAFSNPDNCFKEEIITQKHSTYTSQVYWDICNHSLTSDGEDFIVKLKSIEKDKNKNFNVKHLNEGERKFIPLTNWSKKNLVIEYGKIFEIAESTINIHKYNPNEAKIEFLGKLPVEADNTPFKENTTIIDSKVTNFGTIIETNNNVLLFPSFYTDSSTPVKPIILNTKETEIARWRVFPRSRFYENQLHLIYNNKLVIKSFLYDYFVAQKNKLLGIRPRVSPTY